MGNNTSMLHTFRIRADRPDWSIIYIYIMCYIFVVYNTLSHSMCVCVCVCVYLSPSLSLGPVTAPGAPKARRGGGGWEDRDP